MKIIPPKAYISGNFTSLRNSNVNKKPLQHLDLLALEKYLNRQEQIHPRSPSRYYPFGGYIFLTPELSNSTMRKGVGF